MVQKMTGGGPIGTLTKLSPVPPISQEKTLGETEEIVSGIVKILVPRLVRDLTPQPVQIPVSEIVDGVVVAMVPLLSEALKPAPQEPIVFPIEEFVGALVKPLAKKLTPKPVKVPVDTIVNALAVELKETLAPKPVIVPVKDIVVELIPALVDTMIPLVVDKVGAQLVEVLTSVPQEADSEEGISPPSGWIRTLLQKLRRK